MKRALYEAILADPEDDLAREAYADYLDETASEPADIWAEGPPCYACEGVGQVRFRPESADRYTWAHKECAVCRGVGKTQVLKLGVAAGHAELIRLQVKTDKLRRECGCHTCTTALAFDESIRSGGKKCALLTREFSPLLVRENYLLNNLPGEVFGVNPFGHSWKGRTHPHGFYWEIRRGFPGAIKLPSRYVLGGTRCESCYGRNPYRVNEKDQCWSCGGTGKMPSHAAALGALPLTWMAFSDKSPRRTAKKRGGMSFTYAWWREGELNKAPYPASPGVDDAELPPEFFPGLPDARRANFPSPIAAVGAVSKKTLQFCREAHLKARGDE